MNETQLTPAADTQAVILYDSVGRLLRFWWLVVLAAIAGGVLGMAASRLAPPLYESRAVFSANLDLTQIDLSKFPNQSLSQYEEDMALDAVRVALLAVMPQVAADAQAQGLAVTPDDLREHSSIGRTLSTWTAAYRHTDPAAAQAVTGLWAARLEQAVAARRESGQVKPYLLFETVSAGELPTAPTYRQTAQFALVGTLLGLLAGVIAAQIPGVTQRFAVPLARRRGL